MMRFLGNTFAKFGRRGRLQNRNFSSARETDVTTINNSPGYLSRAVVFGVGYMIGGWILPPVSKQVQEIEEGQMKLKQRLDEHESDLKAIIE